MTALWRLVISAACGYTAADLLACAQEPIVCNQACLENNVGFQTLVQLSHVGIETTTDHNISEDVLTRKLGRERSTFEAIKKLQQDCHQVVDQLLPQIKFQEPIALAAGHMLVVCLWFAAYFKWIYQPDGHQHVSDSKKATRQQRLKRAKSMVPAGMTPDVILVFDNPGCHPPDRQVQVSMRQIDNVLLSETCWKRTQLRLGIRKMIPMSSSFMDVLFVQTRQRWVPATDGLPDMPVHVPTPSSRRPPPVHSPYSQSMPVRSFRLSAESAPVTTEASLSEAALDDIFENRSFDTVHVAMMQDLANLLLTRGFELKVHKSPDDKLLLFAVGLCDDAVMEHYIVRDNLMLHVKSEVVQRMGLNLDGSASNTLTLPFDPRIVSSLHEAGITEEPTKTALFRTFPAPHRESEDVVLNDIDRSRIILRELGACIDLDAAKDNRLLVDWYPVHSSRIHHLNETWGSWRHILSLSFTQPITPIREYFGSQIAFMFAFKGFFCKALLCLLPVAVAWEIIRHMSGGDAGEDHGFRGRNVVSLPCFMFIVWARLAVNGLKREQRYLTALWNDDRSDQVMVRPQFRGFPGPSTLDANEVEDQYPPFWYSLRQFCSMCITSVFCVLVLMCIFIWMHQFENKMELNACLVLAAIIKSFDFLYSWLVLRLTHFDNHKYETDYFNSLVTRKCLFQAITNYSAFFSLVFKQALFGHHHCGGYRGCLHQLRYQLIVTQLMLSLFAMGEVAFNVIYVRMAVWRASGMSFAEEQRHYVEYRTIQQVEVVSQLMISLGFIILFGSIAPVMAPLTFLVFVIQLRGYAMILTSTGRRTLPHETVNFTSWQVIAQSLMQGGVLVSGIFVVNYGEPWHDKPLVSKMTGCLIVFVVSCVVWAIVDLCVPPESCSAKTLVAIRAHAVSKIIHACAKVENLLKDKNHELWRASRTRFQTW